MQADLYLPHAKLSYSVTPSLSCHPPALQGIWEHLHCSSSFYVSFMLLKLILLIKRNMFKVFQLENLLLTLQPTSVILWNILKKIFILIISMSLIPQPTWKYPLPKWKHILPVLHNYLHVSESDEYIATSYYQTSWYHLILFLWQLLQPNPTWFSSFLFGLPLDSSWSSPTNSGYSSIVLYQNNCTTRNLDIPAPLTLYLLHPYVLSLILWIVFNYVLLSISTADLPEPASLSLVWINAS